MRIFLAGATGAIGKRLVPLLLEAGFQVVGTTRSPSRAENLRAAGVEPVVVDVFDRASLVRVAVAAHPDIVIQQLTDLPPGLDPSQMAEGTRRNARMRSEGTRNLVAAALEAGVPRLIAQSIAWMYAPGREPHAEDDALDIAAHRRNRPSLRTPVRTGHGHRCTGRTPVAARRCSSCGGATRD